jgi:hypothetical protein
VNSKAGIVEYQKECKHKRRKQHERNEKKNEKRKRGLGGGRIEYQQFIRPIH